MSPNSCKNVITVETRGQITKYLPKRKIIRPRPLKGKPAENQFDLSFKRKALLKFSLTFPLKGKPAGNSVRLIL